MRLCRLVLSKNAAVIIFALVLATAPMHAHASAQQNSAASTQSSPENSGPAAELARETRLANGEEEENGNLKHSAAIRYVASKTGITVHQAHVGIVIINFLIIAFLIYWFARKSIPAALRARSESIQRALEEGRVASQEANRRLADIESRLGKLHAEIEQMQSQSEDQAAAEEARIKQAAEDEIRKVVQAAEQEIASAAKQARRELSAHTADLAVALARKQIHVDASADQTLVRTFATNLSSGNGKDRA